MMPDLRARIRAAAERREAPAPEAVCRVIDSVTPLSALADLAAVDAVHVRRLGLSVDAFDVRRALFLDTETTGLRGAGTVAFLVGLGWIEEDTFRIRQVLMRDYPEELPLLSVVAERMQEAEVIVSFNGKSFDMPLLRDRFTMARMRDRWLEKPQLDLLHAARRTWRLRLGRCNLGSLEEKVLDIRREGDLPGAEVPERYFQFLKTGDAALLNDVLRHNEQDVRTLAHLLARLGRVYAAPHEQTSMLDVFSAGRALERAGEGVLARRCFSVASVSELSRQSRLLLARSFRREKAYREAADAYRGMIACGEADAEAYQALAILLERHLGDAPGALAVTEEAVLRFSGRTDRETMARLMRRRARLQGRKSGQGR